MRHSSSRPLTVTVTVLQPPGLTLIRSLLGYRLRRLKLSPFVVSIWGPIRAPGSRVSSELSVPNSTVPVSVLKGVPDTPGTLQGILSNMTF